MRASRVTRVLFVLAALLLTLAPRAVRPLAAQAAGLTFVVNTTTDAYDAHLGDGVCATSAGQCSLRAAIAEANAAARGSATTITVPAGVYQLALGTLALTRNTITINGAGSGAGGTTIGGLGQFMVLSVYPGVVAALSGVTIIGGHTTLSLGAGIANAGDLTVTATLVISNTAVGGVGGGLYNTGTLTVTSSAVQGNGAAVGGGIVNSGVVTLVRTTVSGNGASLAGGMDNTGTATLASSTISGNTAATGDGGGVYNTRTLTVSNSTISGNTAAAGNGGGIVTTAGSALSMGSSAVISNTALSGSGGGLFSAGAGITLTNNTLSGNVASQGGGLYAASAVPTGTLLLAFSTISNNTATGAGGGLFAEQGVAISATGTLLGLNTPANCQGVITEGPGFNLDSGTSCGLAKVTDWFATNPILGALAANGGATPTQALLPGSPAINHGGTRASGCPPTDQRRVGRPQGPACDIGAFERGVAAGSLQGEPAQ